MTEANRIYADIETRTGGNIYIGVVGPVRSGKSTFIKRFLDTIVLPNMEGEYEKARAVDEMPQSAGGRTIMTTEPKFIPEQAVPIRLGNDAHLKVRLVDCVGFVVPSAIGYIEEDAPRMVQTPWSDQEMPFHMAAEIGTKKVISEHSTIGLVITTDGSITDIPREEYALAEERVVTELKECDKPFVMILNSIEPEGESAQLLAGSLSEKYSIPVIALNCLEVTQEQIEMLLKLILMEFPISRIEIPLPEWLFSLESTHPLKKDLVEHIASASEGLIHLREVPELAKTLAELEYVQSTAVKDIDLANGCATVRVKLKKGLFFKIVEEKTGIAIENEQQLLSVLLELSEIKAKFQKVQHALEEVENTGYGIVMPELSELTLEEPELMKQGGRYGVRLKASAPSIHMMRADIMTEVAPIVGSESQSEDLVLYLMKQFEENPSEIWNSDIFGKSIYSIVTEGLNGKLSRMPLDARGKLRETVEKVINEGCNGLICIIL